MPINQPANSLSEAERLHNAKLAIYELADNPPALYQLTCAIAAQLTSINPRRVRDDNSNHPQQTLLAAQTHLDQTVQLLAGLSYTN